MERELTIRRLFAEERIQFVIPLYQRAYSWGSNMNSESDNQIIQFIEDLKEQKKRYFLGHFLFEKENNDENICIVIDGQQRLTSIVIFFSCMIKVLQEREQNGEKLIDYDGEPIELWRLIEVFLISGKRRKFKTVDYDDNYFENLIINHHQENIANTDSKKKIKAAYDYFIKVMTEEATGELVRWKKIVENAVITKFEIRDKIQATEIYGFQNNRGKGLTNLKLHHRILITLHIP